MAISESDFEQLSQLLDGELDTPGQQHLEQRLALEPELASAWRQLQTVHATLRQAYAGSNTATVPSSVRCMLDGEKHARDNADKVVPLFSARKLLPAALAASLVLAVSIALLPGNESQPQVGAGLTLAAALESLPSGDAWHVLEDGRRVQPVLTFPRNGEGWCREYLLRDDDSELAQRGVACRSAGDWHTEVLAQGTRAQSNHEYRPAGAGSHEAVEQFIRENAADIPLDTNQEELIIQRHWR